MSLSTPFKKLLKELVEFDGMVFHFESMKSHYLFSYKKRPLLKDKKILLGSRIAYKHPTTLKFTLTDSYYLVNKTNFNSSVKNIEKYIANYFASQSYEAFETYLYGITAKAAIMYPKNLIKIKRLLKNTNQKDYRFQLKKNYRNCYDLYRMVTLKLVPRLQDDITFKYPNYTKFVSFLKCYSLVRNSITHSNSYIHLAEVKSYTSEEFAILKDFFGVNITKKRSSASIDTSREIKNIIATLAQLASLMEDYLV